MLFNSDVAGPTFTLVKTLVTPCPRMFASVYVQFPHSLPGLDLNVFLFEAAPFFPNNVKRTIMFNIA